MSIDALDKQRNREKTYKSVTTVNTEISTSRERTRVGRKVDDGTLEILGFTDSTHRGQVDPGVSELGIPVEDDSGQGSRHVSGGNDVDTDVLRRPFDRERGSQVSDS